jgi:hypothetical protein
MSHKSKQTHYRRVLELVDYDSPTLRRIAAHSRDVVARSIARQELQRRARED